MDDAVAIGRAQAKDAVAISSILALNRDDPGLFQEAASAIAGTLEDFLVARDKAQQVVGCAGLHRDSHELAEIYAVAVSPACQGKGIGRRLMEACQERARSSGIREVWLATIKPEYFSRYGFQPISRWDLPASVLLRKLRQTVQQPFARWLPTLAGKHAFMRWTVTAT